MCAPGGEVVQTTALGPALRRAFPDAMLVLSTTNVAFLAVAERIGGLDRCFFTPFDRRGPVRRALARLRPDLVVTIESAWTPVLLREARRRGVVTMLGSGTMTADYHLERSYARAMRHRVLDSIDVVGVKDAAEPPAFVRLGVPSQRIRVLGDLRHDAAFFRVDEDERARLRTRLGLHPDEGVLVAGSVREGEEAAILDAYARLREKSEGLRLVIAPRFIAHAALVVREAAARGLGVERVSEGTPHGADVIVLDTYGDLARVYGLARYVFLGGTLVQVGGGLGQNLIEPLAHGVPIFFGPHAKRWTAITNELCGIFPGLAVEGADDLVAGVLALEAAPSTVAALRERAHALIVRGADATARHVEAIREALARTAKA